ncbi:MAG: CHAD domain-containing protein [Deltaproteobacteria bacterium]|nr:CHAD domain-containing protein [Deltaproteobacteria bacterium]
MPTPTEPTPGTAELHPQPEHDKLGPFGMKSSALHDPAELRAKLLGEFREAVAAVKQAVLRVDESSATAVHDSRKALRRARAVLSMIAGALPKRERRAVKVALQEARRSLSTVRDHAVAPETLGELELADEDRDTARRVVENAAPAIPAAAELKQLLSEAAARAAAQAEALGAALPPEVKFATIVDGIMDVYGQARRARRLSKTSRQWFHTWRRRTKELVYQLDVVASLAGARTLAIRSEIDGVADHLSSAVDLVMLREFVETHGQGIGLDPVKQLRDVIDARLDDLMKSGRKAARDVFSQKQKKFGRRLTKSVKRDLTPVDGNGANGDDGDLDDA